MNIKEIFKEINHSVIYEIESSDGNLQSWTFNKTSLKYIPNKEGLYLVPGYKIDKNKNIEYVYLSISTPERIIDDVFYKSLLSIKKKYISNFKKVDIIPRLASLCFGSYELYYSKNDPQVGINILTEAMHYSNSPIIAEDLGYILRDEKRFIEAISAFEKSIINTPSSEFIYYELSELYKENGDLKNFEKFKKLFKKYGV
ncbi:MULTISPECIES: tetratricopeptide repeat protein [Leptospira]|uniref:tetratricopeptide repeat protein n=1 Tax=Leptospira TaxID=171 RepID=UPI001EE78459|nr:MULTISPECIES: hypothetical protein [Leptospira]MCG6146561.1 hypothetical protein [Leptospira bandrabouensis]MCG6162005.1 hypothetical protein [Leptospira bandrabouensis]MCG6166218.1 hypothetical protein [Leptospira bandrabouensis]MCW7483321.1 hypothetical protein [Leptospira kanakyensis]